MALIQVTPELLRGKATELRGLRSEHDEVMNKMKVLIQGLNEIWKGEAQDAFVSKYEGMQSTFTSFSELLEAYAGLMDLSAKDMEETDVNISQTINSSF